MVAQLTDDILNELDRTQGEPVQFEDPRNRERYVLIPFDAYQRLLPLLEPRPWSKGKPPVKWNERKNGRRCDLIRQEIAGALTAAEKSELESLQDEFYRYREQVAPLPLEMLKLVEESLERRAAERASAAAP